jgi:predicted dehydrogenase
MFKDFFNMKNEYTWGIIGPGKIAQKFAAALPLASNAILGALASRDAAKVERFAEKFGAVKWYDNYEELAKDPDIDAIYIATLCTRNGKAGLYEEPMALSQMQIKEMVSAAESNNAFLMKAMWTRFCPVTEKALELIHRR